MVGGKVRRRAPSMGDAKRCVTETVSSREQELAGYTRLRH